MLSLAVYSWAGEKFAWLVMHPLLPLMLLAGVGLQAIWEARGELARTSGSRSRRSRWSTSRRVLLGSTSRDARRPARDARLHAVLDRGVKQVADQVLALADSRGPGKPPLTVTVDAAQGATFPYAWYFRHLDGRLHRPRQAERAAADTDVVIVTDEAAARGCGNALSGYDGRKFQFRVWWVRDYGEISPGDLVGLRRPAQGRGTPPAACRSGSTSRSALADGPTRSCPAVE